MICTDCKQPKTKEQMDFNHVRIAKICVDCAGLIRVERVKAKRVRQRKFVRKFNMMMGSK